VVVVSVYYVLEKWAGVHSRRLNPLDSPGEHHICVMVHPVCAKFKMASGHLDAATKPLLGIPEAQRGVLSYERAVDVVDVLGVPAALESRMQDHHAAAVYDEADLPPERAVKTLGEVGQDLYEEISGERDVVDGFEVGRTWRDDRGPIVRPPGLRHRDS
jgi:hypothetical protein